MFAKLKGMMFEEDAVAPAANAAPTVKVQSNGQTRTYTPAATLASDVATETVGDVLDVATIAEQIDQQIRSYPGYAEFAQFQEKSDALNAVIVDEPTRFKAAGATTGLSKEALIASVETSKFVIGAEIENFNASFVAERETAIANLNTDVASADAEIVQLTQRLGEVTQHKNDLQKQIVTESSILAKARIDFNGVVDVLQKRYAAVSTKLQQYL